jgi:Uma2 family endonuclease
LIRREVSCRVGRIAVPQPPVDAQPEVMMNAIATLQPPAVATEPAPEEPLYEIVNGQTVELPPMSIYSTRVAGKLFSRLDVHTEAHALGTAVMEGLFILDAVRNLRRRPDVAFVSAAKWPLDRLLPESGDWRIVPDLAVEVVSPTDVFQDVLSKMREYFHVGVSQVWIVLPTDHEIYVYDSPTNPRVLTAADELDGGALLPGLHLAVGSLFQRQPPATPAAQPAGAPGPAKID